MSLVSDFHSIRSALMQNARIQIVEDERIVALDLKETIEALGFDVTGLAARGEDAILLAAQDRPDLILMDINLEGPMDGTEAALRIREEHRIPVMFLTAYAEDIHLQKARLSSPYGYLVKPFEARELRAMLTMALERRRAELATEESEERLRLALEAGAMVAWEWGNEESKAWVGGDTIGFGHSVPEVLRMGRDALLEKIHPDDRATVRAALEERRGIDTQVRLRNGNESYRWVELHAKTFPQASGDGVRVIGVASDVTEQHELLDRLRNTQAAIDAVGDGIVILDSQRKIQSVNHAFGTLTGYTADEVLGRDPDDFLHARRHSDQFYPRIDRLAGGRWKGEIACRRKNGTVFPTIQTVSCVSNDDSSIANYVLSISDISALRKTEQRVEHLALHDALTGLGNRRLLQERLDVDLANAKRANLPLGILFLDLDGFKNINDSLGHDAGDIILKTIAERVQKCIRRDDLAIRIGGDEFLIVVPARGEQECIGLSGKLLSTISQPVMLGGEPVSITGSIGIALFPAHGTSTSELIKSADSAMYEAKRNGRNRFAFHTEHLANRARERMQIEQGLRRGLAQSEIQMHYQPIVRLTDYRIVGFETLARWTHPVLGAISPAQFIPVAEDAGFIDELGDYVLRQACIECMRNGPMLVDDPWIAVNVSVRQFLGADLVGRVQRILEETGFPAGQLELEITESALHQEEGSDRAILERLKRLGVSIAIDDFGTGYSSLSLLNRLPIDTIKIDRSFVSALPADKGAVAITRAILAMARSLGLHVTAEGIETYPQLLELQTQGCPRGQGFLFSRGGNSEAALRQTIARTLPPTQ
jgi:diguanylate cyclase (GGDEF)-like protein/PAS domain S-box-containing protein